MNPNSSLPLSSCLSQGSDSYQIVKKKKKKDQEHVNWKLDFLVHVSLLLFPFMPGRMLFYNNSKRLLDKHLELGLWDLKEPVEQRLSYADIF